MSTRRVAAVCVLCVLVPAASGAGQEIPAGFFVGARAGTSSMDTPTVRDREGPGLRDYDRRDRTWSIFGGHEWVVRSPVRVGVEIGYADHGAATITYASGNTYAFTSSELYALGTVAMTYRRIIAGVEAGVSRTRARYRLSAYVSGIPDVDSEQTKDLPVGAVTVGYQITRRIAAIVNVRRVFGDEADTVTKALINSNPTPPPFRDVLNSVPRVTALSFGLRIGI